jgi:hypothetical protein
MLFRLLCQSKKKAQNKKSEKKEKLHSRRGLRFPRTQCGAKRLVEGRTDDGDNEGIIIVTTSTEK